MRNPFGFFFELIQQPVWIPVWVLFLMITNVTSIAFWSEPVAKVIFLTFILSSILMVGLYTKFGYEKILGAGHILWIPLLIYVLMEIPVATAGFKSYLIIFSVATAISLVFDVVDVGKYFADRQGLGQR